MDVELSSVIKIICILNAIFPRTNALASITDAENLHADLFSYYNRNVRPVEDQGSALPVDVYMYISRLQEFDDVHEKFSFSAAFFVSWFDYKLRWNTSDYNGLSQITAPHSAVWVPELILASPANKMEPLGRSTDIIRLRHDGEVNWLPSSLIESTCSVNVKYYPFDTQSCDVSFVSLGYKKSEVLLIHGVDHVLMDVYLPNALWDITGSTATTKDLVAGEIELRYTINFKRKSSLVILNIVLPILLLSFVNSLVFLLEPQSGERIGYCITTLLAIAVYMTIVSDMLPQNPQSIPLISFKLFIDLFLSALIVFCVIINFKIYFRDDEQEVPGSLQNLYRKLTSCVCRKRKIEPENNKEGKKANAMTISTPDTKERHHYETKSLHGKLENNEIDLHNTDETPVTWKKISFMFDRLALITFCVLELLNFFLFIIVAISNSP
ncbi:hypothetical protein ACF0H5_020142 [Mactra antiquata]